MEEKSDDKIQINESDSESTHEDELESQSESSKQSRPSINLENGSETESDETEHEVIFNQIRSKYNNKKRSNTPSPISSRSNSQSNNRHSKTPSISSQHHSVSSSNSIPVYDRLYAESYVLRRKREEQIKNIEKAELQKYSSKKRSTSTPLRTNSVYSPNKIKQHYQEREIHQKEAQLKAEEEKRNNETWLCPLCSYCNKMKDKMCMNPMKGGTMKVTIQNLKKCKSQQIEEVSVCGCKQPKLGTPLICKKSKDLMNTPGQNTFQSLYEDSVGRKDRREVLQRADEEKMQKVCTYTPTLNKHSVNIVNKKGDRDKNIGEYLYKQFQLKLKNNNNLELETKSTSSDKNSHLHPYTNETQKEFCDRLYRDGERKELLRKMKENEALQYDEDGHKLFHPHITREPFIINRDPDLDIYTYLHSLSYTQNQKLQLLKENYKDEEQYEINSGKTKNNHTDKVTKRKSEWFFKKVFSIMIDSDVFDNFDEVIIDKTVIEKDYSIFRKECQIILNKFFIKNLNQKFTFLPFSHTLYKYIVTSTGGRFAFVTAPEAKVDIPPEFDEKEIPFSPKINPKSHQILKCSENYINNNNNNQSIYTTLYEDHLNHQKRLEHLKELYLSQQCEEYTFQPQVGRKPQHDVNNTTIRTSLSNNSKNSTPMKVDHSIYKEEEFDDYD